VLKKLLCLISLVSPATILAVSASPCFAGQDQVQFDGRTWRLAKKPQSLRISSQGYLEWTRPGPSEPLIVRFDPMPLNKPGDIVRIVCVYKADVPASPPCCLRKSDSNDIDHLSSATPNFFIGLFDSSENGAAGACGYYASVFPHIPESFVERCADGQVRLPGKVLKRNPAGNSCLFQPPDSAHRAGSDISGFSAPVGRFVPLMVRLKRTAPNSVNFAVSVDNVTYHRFDEAAADQPRKINTLAIYFPNAGTCEKITLAPFSARPPAPRPASMRHVVVYKEPGHFAGWPANNGAWSWGNEIVVRFASGWYAPSYTRSFDGGETWTIEQPRYAPIKDTNAPVSINFTHPDLAMLVHGNKFFVSYDRARTWQGRYHFKGIDFGLTSRTDYIVEGPNECLFFLSAPRPETSGSNHSDRALMAKTTDGGRSFRFVAWLTHEPIKARSVMPSTVRTSPTRLVTITRRKIRNFYARKYTNWIEASVSEDNGASWRFLSRVALTDRGEENGSPPALVRLADGRLVVAYGYRSWPFGIRARISEDGGKTWSDEIVLRDDGATWDIGYPRMVVRPDGKLVTMYYHNTPDHPASYIVATIWDPDTVTTAPR